jgi:transcriptional regulator with XRE-family HTH domain
MEPIKKGVASSGAVTLDVSELGRLVRERRGQTSLRVAAEEANVSFSTLSRVEGGAQPDLASFTSLCAWLGVPPTRFINTGPAREVDPLEKAISHLHQDPRLEPAAAESISSMLRTMYQSLAKDLSDPRPMVACHLRAASVLRPGVAQRLAPLLQDMHDGLEQKFEEGLL